MEVTKHPLRDTSATDRTSAGLEVHVLFTSVRTTLAALREAAKLAADLHARIRIIAPTIVPYPLPLDRPPLATAHQCRQFLTLAGGTAIETRVENCYCRDPKDAFASLLPPNALIVIGGARHWWRTSAQRTAKQLREAGHHVVLVDTGAAHA